MAAPAMRTLTTTQVYRFSKYSKASQLPPGEALRSKPFRFHGRSWRIKVYPTGYSPASRDFLAVFLRCRTEPFDFDLFAANKIAIEILDKDGESVVFDDATAQTKALVAGDGGFSKGFVEFARRREMEASSCIHDDGFTVRCTLVLHAAVAKPSVFPWRRTAPIVVDDDDGVHTVVPTSPSSSLVERFAPQTGADTDTAWASDNNHYTGVPEVVTESHTLTITGFSEKQALLACGQCVRSAQFSVGGSNWYIKVYPNGHDIARDSVTFFLARGKSGEPETTAEFAFELANLAGAGNNKNYKSAKARETFDSASDAAHLVLECAAAGLQSAVLASGDRLVVWCKLGVYRSKPRSPLLASAPTIPVPPPDADEGRFAGFAWLLNSQEGSDITFAVGGTTFRAHSCILAAQSPVLRAEVRALAENPECPWRYVEVEDEEVTAEAFEALLHVAYTDRLPDMGFAEPAEERVRALLFAAERYEMERLKLRCEEWLCGLVTVDTVADILSMAVRYDCQLLTAACVEYATPDHVWDLVKETEGFRKLRASCPQIVRDIEGKQRKY